MKRVITYGTFDLLHYGHIQLFRRAKELGDYLIVGISSDEFNALKGKSSYFSFDERRMMVDAIKYVDLVIPENSWDQKVCDIKEYGVSLFVIGDDWQGEFDELLSVCEVKYLPRTPEISSSQIKTKLKCS